MPDEPKSHTSAWIIIALLSSPVIVSLMDMTKEILFGAKENKSMVLLETALAELIASRRTEQVQQKPKVIYVPVLPEMYIPKPLPLQRIQAHHQCSGQYGIKNQPTLVTFTKKPILKSAAPHADLLSQHQSDTLLVT